MGGVDQLTAFEMVGLDASYLALPTRRDESPQWRYRWADAGRQGNEALTRHWIETPDGELTWLTGANEYTTYHIEHIIKSERDAEMFFRYWPRARLDREQLAGEYARVGDRGIVRGFVDMFAQPGCWQEFCEMVGTQEAIYWATDRPGFVHWLLEQMT